VVGVREGRVRQEEEKEEERRQKEVMSYGSATLITL
jgi:hypothetical protein